MARTRRCPRPAPVVAPAPPCPWLPTSSVVDVVGSDLRVRVVGRELRLPLTSHTEMARASWIVACHWAWCEATLPSERVDWGDPSVPLDLGTPRGDR